MNVILTDDVVGLGDIGERVSVKPGYARNFLIPRGLAIETSSASGKVIAHKMLQIEAKKKKLKATAQDKAKELEARKIKLALRVGSNGRVFGSLSAKDIAAALEAEGYDVDRRRVVLPEPIKKIGEHRVRVKVHAEVEAWVKVEVVEMAATAEEEEKETAKARAEMEEKSSKKKEKLAKSEDDAEAEE